MNGTGLRTRTGARRAADESWRFEAKHASPIRTEKLGTTSWADGIAALRGSGYYVGTQHFYVRMVPPVRDTDVVVVFARPKHYPDPVAREFRELADQWKNETAFVGSLSEKVLHPAYQRIIALGTPVISHVLRALESEPDHWFWALRFLTGIDAAEGEDTIDGARRAWLAWGRDRGLLS